MTTTTRGRLLVTCVGGFACTEWELHNRLSGESVSGSAQLFRKWQFVMERVSFSPDQPQSSCLPEGENPSISCGEALRRRAKRHITDLLFLSPALLAFTTGWCPIKKRLNPQRISLGSSCLQNNSQIWWLLDKYYPGYISWGCNAQCFSETGMFCFKACGLKWAQVTMFFGIDV